LFREYYFGGVLEISSPLSVLPTDEIESILEDIVITSSNHSFGSISVLVRMLIKNVRGCLVLPAQFLGNSQFDFTVDDKLAAVCD
jgi:hypothetical protein